MLERMKMEILDATLEITEKGFSVISASGVCRKFDDKGNLLKTYTIKNSSWLKDFFLMRKEEIEEVRQWFPNVTPATKKQKDFLEIVGEGLGFIDFDYRLSKLEPSMNEDGELFFESGNPVETGLSLGEWKRKCQEFAPEWNSRMASIHELYLWYAWRVVKGYWSLEYICDDSSDGANYFTSPNPSHKCEVSGNRVIGGFSDGTGNTYKIVSYGSGMAVCGGKFDDYGNVFPVADESCYIDSEVVFCGTGVIALRGTIN